MELTPEDVQEILRILEQSSFDELYLETPQLKLVVRRGPTGTAIASPVPQHPLPTSPLPSQPATPSSRETGETSLQAPTTTTEPVTPVSTAPEADGTVPIIAPLKGIFYRAPRPGAPPFVEVGSQVRADTVVGIIEVMKLMHSVLAGVHGEIAEVCVENGQAVDRGQPLFRVRPTEEPDSSAATNAP
ncbi:MAG: hypothetical protein NZL87_03660 [Thermomicrobium sp.]|nr:hypothetical protein [Thermomicrobium sp.]MDW7982180.1 biotin/lipoyl-containing protein [Thermomicrobium sp.]